MKQSIFLLTNKIQSQEILAAFIFGAEPQPYIFPDSDFLNISTLGRVI